MSGARVSEVGGADRREASVDSCGAVAGSPLASELDRFMDERGFQYVIARGRHLRYWRGPLRAGDVVLYRREESPT